VEAFSTVLFRTADIVALLTVESEMTPCAKRQVKTLTSETETNSRSTA